LNIATSYDGKLLAIAKTVQNVKLLGIVQILDLAACEKIAEFEVRYDSGGHRLAFSRAQDVCVVGCYRRYGLGAYEIHNGQELWRRKDLKQVQTLSTLPHCDEVLYNTYCGAEYVDCYTGESEFVDYEDLQNLYFSPFDESRLISAKDFEIYSPLNIKITEFTRTTSHELDAAFSPNAVVVSEGGGPVRCFNLSSGDLLWTYLPLEGSHVRRLSFSKQSGSFVGWEWRYRDRHQQDRLLNFDQETGHVINAFGLNPVMEAEFCLEGAALFNSDCQLLSSATGELFHAFPDSQRS